MLNKKINHKIILSLITCVFTIFISIMTINNIANANEYYQQKNETTNFSIEADVDAEGIALGGTFDVDNICYTFPGAKDISATDVTHFVDTNIDQQYVSLWPETYLYPTGVGSVMYSYSDGNQNFNTIELIAKEIDGKMPVWYIDDIPLISGDYFGFDDNPQRFILKYLEPGYFIEAAKAGLGEGEITLDGGSNNRFYVPENCTYETFENKEQGKFIVKDSNGDTLHTVLANPINGSTFDTWNITWKSNTLIDSNMLVVGVFDQAPQPDRKITFTKIGNGGGHITDADNNEVYEIYVPDRTNLEFGKMLEKGSNVTFTYPEQAGKIVEDALPCDGSIFGEWNIPEELLNTQNSNFIITEDLNITASFELKEPVNIFGTVVYVDSIQSILGKIKTYNQEISEPEVIFYPANYDNPYSCLTTETGTYSLTIPKSVNGDLAVYKDGVELYRENNISFNEDTEKDIFIISPTPEDEPGQPQILAETSDVTANTVFILLIALLIASTLFTKKFVIK